MPKPKPALEAYEEPVLMFVDPDCPVAYFSTEQQPWGDDWNDAPYEHNAGGPYSWDIRVVYLDANLDAPNANTINSNYSVEQINMKAVPWLVTPSYMDPFVVIHSGATVSEFINKVQLAGGIAFVVPDPKDTHE